MDKIIVKSGQWLGDVALRECGDFESVVDLAILNDISITDNVSGKILENIAVADRKIVKHYLDNNLQPATAVGMSPDAPLLPTGINFMGIEVDFVVS